MGFNILERLDANRERLGRGFGRMGDVFLGREDISIQTPDYANLFGGAGVSTPPLGQAPSTFYNPFLDAPQQGTLGSQSGEFGINFGDGSPTRYPGREVAGVGGAWDATQAAISRGRSNQLRNLLDQLRGKGGGGGGGGGAGAIINKRLARAREELAAGNEEFGSYFEAIAPGFEEATAQALRLAEAEAAIDGHFEQTQEAIDARYADAEGGVRAIADSMGNENASLSEAIHESIYEFKEFIDQDLHLEKEGAQKMNAAASALAAAAAQAGGASARGAGARDQFVFQKKYEKIIQNLLDQRAAAGAARGRSMQSAKEALLQQIRGFSQSTPYTREDMGYFVRGQMMREGGVPPSMTTRVTELQEGMRGLGFHRVADYRNYALIQAQNSADPASAQQQVDALFRPLADYTEIIESGVSPWAERELDRLFDEAYQEPQTDFDLFNVGREQAALAGLTGQEQAAFGNFFLGDQRGDFQADEGLPFDPFDLQDEDFLLLQQLLGNL